ncbi:hypothetical protein Ocin01_08943, partial [Orchesella cincta]
SFQSPQMAPGAPDPQLQPNTYHYHYQPEFPPQVQPPSYPGYMTAQVPVASQPNFSVPRSQHMSRTSEALTNAFQESIHRNRVLNNQVKLNNSEIKTLRDNENYLRNELGATQSRNQMLEYQIQSLQGEVGALRTHSVSKAIHDSLVEQNLIIVGRNLTQSQQIDELQRETERGNVEREEIVSLNHQLNIGIINLNKKLKAEGEKSAPIQINCAKLTKENEKLLTDLGKEKRKVLAQEKKVKTLEKKLLKSETLCKSRDDLILNLNFALESSRNKCQVLEENGNAFEWEKKSLQAQQKELELLQQQINHEKERACAANIALHDKQNEVEALEKQLKEEQAQSRRKSQIIASVKNIKTTEKGESARVLKRLRDQVGILKLEKDSLNKTLDSRREDIRKMQSQMTSLEEANKETASENEVLNKRITELEEVIEKHVMTLEENAKQFQLREEDINRERMSMESSEANLHLLGSLSMQAKIMSLEAEVKEKDKQLKVLSYQKKEREADNVELKKQLNEMKLSGRLCPVVPWFSDRKSASINGGVRSTIKT